MGIYDVESFFGALEQLHGSFSGIGGHQDFQKPKFFMHKLLLKELWSGDVNGLDAVLKPRDQKIGTPPTHINQKTL